MGLHISMAKILQANRFQTLGNDCEDVENTNAIIQSAVNIAKKINKINRLQNKNQKHDNFLNGLIDAKYGKVVEPVKVIEKVIENPVEPSRNNSKNGFKNKPRRDEFDFAKPGFGFVERYEGVGYDKKVIGQRNAEDNFLTLAEYEEKMNIKQPEINQEIVKNVRKKPKKVVINPWYLGFKDNKN